MKRFMQEETLPVSPNIKNVKYLKMKHICYFLIGPF